MIGSLDNESDKNHIQVMNKVVLLAVIVKYELWGSEGAIRG